MAYKLLVTLYSLVVVASAALINPAIYFGSRVIQNTCNCIPLDQCPVLYYNFLTARSESLVPVYGEFVKTYHCGYHGKMPDVCCPLTNTVEAYKNFYKRTFRNDYIVENGKNLFNTYLSQFLPKQLIPQTVANNLVPYKIDDGANKVSQQFSSNLPAHQKGNENQRVSDDLDEIVKQIVEQFLPEPSTPQTGKDENNSNDDIDDVVNTLMEEFAPDPSVSASDSDLDVNKPKSKSSVSASTNIELNGKCGRVSETADFPWLVLLEYETTRGKRFLCGGSLITDRVVLTAGHCVESKSNKLVSARLGEYAPKGPIECSYNPSSRKYECAKGSVDVDVESVHLHEDYYSGNARHALLEQGRHNDVALVKLSQRVGFTEHVRPICLPARTPPEEGDFVIAGWARKIYSKGKMRSGAAFKVREMESACNSYRFDRGEFICVANEHPVTSGSAICVSDAGGPIMAREVKSDGEPRFTLRGISNADTSCRKRGDKYGLLFTRIDPYMPWINSKLREIL